MSSYGRHVHKLTSLGVIGLAGLAATAALVAIASVAVLGHRPARPTSVASGTVPSPPLTKTFTLEGKEGFSFEQNWVTSWREADIYLDYSLRESHLLAADEYDWSLEGSLAWMGTTALGNIREAPDPDSGAYSRNGCFFSPGAAFCVAIDGGKSFAKIKVLSRSGNRAEFEYYYEASGQREFGDRPRSGAPLDRVEDQRRALEERLAMGIPDFRRLLHEQAGEIWAARANANSNATRQQLGSELRDVARLLVALDAYERECEDMVIRLRSAERRIQRQLASEESLGPDASGLLAEVESLEQEAGAKLAVRLDPRLGSGPIDELLVDEQLRRLNRPTSE